MNEPTASTNSIFCDSALLPEGWARNVRIEIADGLITRINRDVEKRSGEPRHFALLPGISNLHSHAFQRGMAGLAETRGASSDSFWTWREIMYRFIDRMTPDDVRAISTMAYVEMLESGFTRVGEFHYLHHDRDGTPFTDRGEMSVAIAAASQESGIALTLLPVFYAYSGFGAQPANHGQRRFCNDLDGFARLFDTASTACRGLDDAVLGVAPHSLRAVSPEQIPMVAALADGAPVHIHIAEQVKELEDCIAWSGQRPVDWLLNHAHVGENWCLVHATHVTDEEVRSVAVTGATIGLCPITEANLGDGLFPAATFVDCGGRYGIGSDSNVLIDATEEMRLLEYGQRLAQQSRNVLAVGAVQSTGNAIYQATVAGGARACGVASGIAVGQPADLVSLKRDHPNFIGRENERLLDSLIFSAGRRGIDAVWRRGRQIVADGRHHRRDQVSARYREALVRLLS